MLAGIQTCGLRAGPKDPVVVSATASPDYIRTIDAQGKPKPESYVFWQGRFFSGNTGERELSRTAFMDIARTLAVDLARQGYWPTRDVAGADLTIVVHWGATLTYDDPQRQFTTEALNDAIAEYNARIAETGMADPGLVNLALEQRATAQAGTTRAVNSNAVLLGYGRALSTERRKPFVTDEEIWLSSELNEERYFVILMAYDARFMRDKHKPRLLWVTRLSIRSIGTGFTEALSALSRAGSGAFGRQVDDLMRVKTPAPEGKVKLHDLEILGTVEAPPPGKGK